MSFKMLMPRNCHKATVLLEVLKYGKPNQLFLWYWLEHDKWIHRVLLIFFSLTKGISLKTLNLFHVLHEKEGNAFLLIELTSFKTLWGSLQNLVASLCHLLRLHWVFNKNIRSSYNGFKGEAKINRQLLKVLQYVDE